MFSFAAVHMADNFYIKPRDSINLIMTLSFDIFGANELFVLLSDEVRTEKRYIQEDPTLTFEKDSTANRSFSGMVENLFSNCILLSWMHVPRRRPKTQYTTQQAFVNFHANIY